MAHAELERVNKELERYTCDADKFDYGLAVFSGLYSGILDAKLDEELAEYHKDQNVEELADLLEVIYAAAKVRGYSIEELERIRKEKADKRGAFDKKIFLETVTENAR